MAKNKVSRRDFISSASTLAASTAVAGFIPVNIQAANESESLNELGQREPMTESNYSSANDLNLAPAQWIWYPAKRILPNSFFHFRKELDIKQKLKSAKGWVVGDSRYILFCNGQRMQFGPAPSDPRFTEADPFDLTTVMAQGMNTIGCTVLYYGFGDGTWPAGKAGFIFKLELEYEDGSTQTIVSDASWKVQLAKSWQPGMYKRWYLRSLQEVFDNRRYPHGWTNSNFKVDQTWKNAVNTGGTAHQTALATSMSDYLYDSGSPSNSQLRKRIIPVVKETDVPVKSLEEAHLVKWHLPALEYFDMLTADAYEGDGSANVQQINKAWQANVPDNNMGLVLTFELTEQVVGFPYCSIEAPEGMIIELMVQQGHVLHGQGGPALINNNLNSWTRFICKEGHNDFITFDYESVKWIQLHLHGVPGSVIVHQPGVRRRIYDFKQLPFLTTSDKALQKLFVASFNTVLNNSQDTIVDCMGRERQQYSGDIGHVIHVLHCAFGEQRLPARFVDTFSQGITLDGFFMDSWPAYDRLNRLAQRQLGLTSWGPLLDHSVGFNYDVWYHYLYSGKKEDVVDVFPRLMRFFQYLQSMWKPTSLLPVENLGVPAIWMDTDSYKKQRHKQCAFNLYVAGMLKDAFARLCDVFSRADLKKQALAMSEHLVNSVRKHFWSKEHGLLINNLPWSKDEGELRTCERSIAHYILSGFASAEEKTKLTQELIHTPPRFGLCYPPNAQWRYWALADCGYIQPVIDELRNKWIKLTAVQQNNTMPETWRQVPDTHAQYSHAALAPIYVAYMSIAGINVLEPGAKRISIKPQPGDLESFSTRHYLSVDAVDLSWEGKRGKRKLTIQIPSGVSAELWLDNREKLTLPVIKKQGNMVAYLLPNAKQWTAVLTYL